MGVWKDEDNRYNKETYVSMDRWESESNMVFDIFLSWSKTALGSLKSVKSSSKLLAMAPDWSTDYKGPFEHSLKV